MKSLIILVATTTLVSGRREAAPGFAVDFRTFGGSRIYQDLPYRERSRLFRESGSPPGQRQIYRPETFREYRPPFAGREEPRIFHDDPRASFKDEIREGFKEELRPFNEDEAGPYRDESRAFKEENRGFNDERGTFRDERFYREGLLRDRPEHFQERPSREEQRPFRHDARTFRDGPYRDEPKPFGDEIQAYEGPRPFRDDFRPFRNEVRSYRDEPTGFRDDRAFRDNSGPLRNEPRPFREESRPFNDESLFTEESRGLAEAQHRFNKEHRQPLSYGGHSNYLKYGNHGLGYASIPSSVLPLEADPPTLSTEIMITDVSTTAATQSPNFLKPNIQETSSPDDVQSSITSSHISVTLAPDVGSTPSQSTSGNTLPHTQQQTNENLVDGGSISGSSNAVTISTSDGTSVTPKVLFTSGPAAMTSASMAINSVDTDNSVQRGSTPDSLQSTKQGLTVVAPASTYFPIETRPEVPEALLNYVFKYRTPEEPKIRYTFRSSPQSETAFNQIQSVPLIQHHQSAKYTVLPELKISGLSTMGPGPTVNYVSSPAVPKLSFLNPTPPGLNLNSYASENLPSLNFAGNLIQLDRETRYSPVDHQLTALQSGQYPLRQFVANEFVPQMRHYANLGQPQQTNNVPFTQGLPLQLGGFGGIDYSALTGREDASRGTTSVNLGPSGSTFTKIPFGQSLWRL